MLIKVQTKNKKKINPHVYAGPGTRCQRKHLSKNTYSSMAMVPAILSIVMTPIAIGTAAMAPGEVGQNECYSNLH
jgi:hypothetical protein